ncbi:MAG: hypothetical protein ACK5Q5_07925, partial [Planctomycetaceae bacterium]
GLLWGMHPQPADRDAARPILDSLRRLTAGTLDPPGSLARDSRRFIRSWFRNHPEELQQVQPLETAMDYCKSLLKPTRKRASYTARGQC